MRRDDDAASLRKSRIDDQTRCGDADRVKMDRDTQPVEGRSADRAASKTRTPGSDPAAAKPKPLPLDRLRRADQTHWRSAEREATAASPDAHLADPKPSGPQYRRAFNANPFP